jgi:hypothetical protein
MTPPTPFFIEGKYSVCFARRRRQSGSSSAACSRPIPAAKRHRKHPRTLMRWTEKLQTQIVKRSDQAKGFVVLPDGQA